MPRTPDSTFNLATPERSPAPQAAPAPPASPATPADLSDLGPIGQGGMGEVRRVWEPALQRRLACKSLLAGQGTQAKARFLREAQVTARLAHPGVIPVHQLGTLPDGRPFFTMEEVEGRTFDVVIHEVHRVSTTRWGTTNDGWSLHRLVDALRRICETVAYAHTQGVVHRDIKPSNLMVGTFGRVLVLDWGLAGIFDDEDDDDGSNPELTQAGQVAGTPGWMAPEQASGGLALLTPAADVYALGCVLYLLLTGVTPYREATSKLLISAVLAGPPPHPCDRTSLPLPDELVEICLRAMARTPADRYPNAAALADAVGAWLEGARRLEKAQLLLQQADRLAVEVEQVRARASALRDQVEQAQASLPPYAGVEQRREIWKIEDEAAAFEREADLCEIEMLKGWQAALIEVPDLEDAHQRIADHYYRQAQEAEQRRDHRAIPRLEALIAAHDRGARAAWLQGEGTLSLITDPPDAQATIIRLEQQDRRLLDGPVVWTGTAPLSLRLPHGSYVIRLAAPGHESIVYPAFLRRGEAWDGAHPTSRQPTPIRLPPKGTLGAEDCLIPAGWAELGDPTLTNGLPRRRVWVDSVVMRRHPVTNREYLDFLNALVAEGREAEALQWAPQSPTGAGQVKGALIYGYNGEFTLIPDAEGDVWEPDWPVVLVTWDAAMAFAAWEAARTGLPWRLVWEPEWEKALRGVDGRSFPWGDHLEPTWFRNAQAAPGRPKPARIMDYPTDVSIYGVRGLSGNVRDWSLSVRGLMWEDIGESGLFLPPTTTPETDAWRLTLGGAWNAGPGFGRAGHRFGAPPAHRNALLGFRLARSLS